MLVRSITKSLKDYNARFFDVGAPNQRSSFYQEKDQKTVSEFYKEKNDGGVPSPFVPHMKMPHIDRGDAGIGEVDYEFPYVPSNLNYVHYAMFIPGDALLEGPVIGVDPNAKKYCFYRLYYAFCYVAAMMWQKHKKYSNPLERPRPSAEVVHEFFYEDRVVQKRLDDLTKVGHFAFPEGKRPNGCMVHLLLDPDAFPEEEENEEEEEEEDEEDEDDTGVGFISLSASVRKGKKKKKKKENVRLVARKELERQYSIGRNQTLNAETKMVGKKHPNNINKCLFMLLERQHHVLENYMGRVDGTLNDYKNACPEVLNAEVTACLNLNQIPGLEKQDWYGSCAQYLDLNREDSKHRWELGLLSNEGESFDPEILNDPDSITPFSSVFSLKNALKIASSYGIKKKIKHTHWHNHAKYISTVTGDIFVPQSYDGYQAFMVDFGKQEIWNDMDESNEDVIPKILEVLEGLEPSDPEFHYPFAATSMKTSNIEFVQLKRYTIPSVWCFLYPFVSFINSSLIKKVETLKTNSSVVFEDNIDSSVSRMCIDDADDALRVESLVPTFIRKYMGYANRVNVGKRFFISGYVVAEKIVSQMVKYLKGVTSVDEQISVRTDASMCFFNQCTAGSTMDPLIVRAWDYVKKCYDEIDTRFKKETKKIYPRFLYGKFETQDRKISSLELVPRQICLMKNWSASKVPILCLAMIVGRNIQGSIPFNVMLTGPAGTGKSLVLLYLAKLFLKHTIEKLDDTSKTGMSYRPSSELGMTAYSFEEFPFAQFSDKFGGKGNSMYTFYLGSLYKPPGETSTRMVTQSADNKKKATVHNIKTPPLRVVAATNKPETMYGPLADRFTLYYVKPESVAGTNYPFKYDDSSPYHKRVVDYSRLREALINCYHVLMTRKFFGRMNTTLSDHIHRVVIKDPRLPSVKRIMHCSENRTHDAIRCIQINSVLGYMVERLHLRHDALIPHNDSNKITKGLRIWSAWAYIGLDYIVYSYDLSMLKFADPVTSEIIRFLRSRLVVSSGEALYEKGYVTLDVTAGNNEADSKLDIPTITRRNSRYDKNDTNIISEDQAWIQTLAREGSGFSDRDLVYVLKKFHNTQLVYTDDNTLQIASKGGTGRTVKGLKFKDDTIQIALPLLEDTTTQTRRVVFDAINHTVMADEPYPMWVVTGRAIENLPYLRKAMIGYIYHTDEDVLEENGFMNTFDVVKRRDIFAEDIKKKNRDTKPINELFQIVVPENDEDDEDEEVEFVERSTSSSSNDSTRKRKRVGDDYSSDVDMKNTSPKKKKKNKRQLRMSSKSNTLRYDDDDKGGDEDGRSSTRPMLNEYLTQIREVITSYGTKKSSLGESSDVYVNQNILDEDMFEDSKVSSSIDDSNTQSGTISFREIERKHVMKYCNEYVSYDDVVKDYPRKFETKGFANKIITSCRNLDIAISALVKKMRWGNPSYYTKEEKAFIEIDNVIPQLPAVYGYNCLKLPKDICYPRAFFLTDKELIPPSDIMRSCLPDKIITELSKACAGIKRWWCKNEHNPVLKKYITGPGDARRRCMYVWFCAWVIKNRLVKNTLDLCLNFCFYKPKPVIETVESIFALI